jgi:DNA-binding transcriptional LysR family regulator
MTLSQLEYFCAVCRYHSITRAAEELYVSQPTISVALKELEKEFKIRLFHHGRNRITITEEGAAFYKKADRILKEVHDMHTEFSALDKVRRPLRIGIPPMISTVFFPRIIDRFHEEYGDIPVQMLEYGSVRACHMVESEELDLAMINMDFYNIDKFNYDVMMEDRYVLCVAKNHKLAGEKRIRFEMLENEPLVLFNTDSVQNQTVNARFRSLGITPQILVYSSQLATVLNFVRGGGCGAFLYSSLAVNPRDFVVIPIEPEMTSKFGIVWKKGVFVSDTLTKLIRFFQSFDTKPFLPDLK